MVQIFFLFVDIFIGIKSNTYHLYLRKSTYFLNYVALFFKLRVFLCQCSWLNQLCFDTMLYLEALQSSRWRCANAHTYTIFISIRLKILQLKLLISRVIKNNQIEKLLPTNAVPYTSLLSRRLNCLRDSASLPFPSLESQGRLFQRMAPL